jgi:hypothetical protein
MFKPNLEFLAQELLQKIFVESENITIIPLLSKSFYNFYDLSKNYISKEMLKKYNVNVELEHAFITYIEFIDYFYSYIDFNDKNNSLETLCDKFHKYDTPYYSHHIVNICKKGYTNLARLLLSDYRFDKNLLEYDICGIVNSGHINIIELLLNKEINIIGYNDFFALYEIGIYFC